MGSLTGSRCQRHFSAFFVKLLWMCWNYVGNALNELKLCWNVEKMLKIQNYSASSAHFSHNFSAFWVQILHKFQQIFSTHFLQNFQRKFSESVKKFQRLWENVETIKFQRISDKFSAQIQTIRKKVKRFRENLKTIKFQSISIKFVAQIQHIRKKVSASEKT